MIVHSANFDKIDFFSVSDFQRFSTALILVWFMQTIFHGDNIHDQLRW